MSRRELSLDGQWLFRIDMADRPFARDWHTAGFRPRNWLEVTVPGSWDTYLPELDGYAGHGWYWRTFKLGQDWCDLRVQLHFDGANYETTVWVNGRQAGVHSGGFDPFQFDITDLVNWQGENILAVRVDNCGRLDRVPHNIIGWWNYGGIFRSVRLCGLPRVRVDDVFVRAEPGSDDSGAPLQIDAVVVNDGDRAVKVALAATVSTSGGDEVATIDKKPVDPIVTVPPGSRVPVSMVSRIPDAKPWSPATPNLYALRLELREARKNLDTLGVRFGVRRFEVCGTRLHLNGQPIVLKGFNRHEEYPGTGRVDPGGIQEADLKLIKELDGNMVRMHYQLHPDLYDLADEMGLLVFSEIPLAFCGLQNIGREQLVDPVIRETAESMLRTLIGELKNHPSVVIWSVGNECATVDDDGRGLISHLVDVARSLDDTRPITYVSNMHLREKCFDLVDIQCANVYFGLRSAELGELLDKLHAMEPEKPLLITEFGMQSVRGLSGEDWCGEELHAQVLEENWKVFRSRRDFIPGALIWCLADYRVCTRDPDGHLLNKWRFCHGILALDRKPKKSVVATVKRLFAHASQDARPVCE